VILFVHNHPSKFVQIDLELLPAISSQRMGTSRIINFMRVAIAERFAFGLVRSWHVLFLAQ
jgi:hypothetical protein